MRKTLVLSALIFAAALSQAQELLPGNMPGLAENPAEMRTPDSKMIISELSPALRLSSKQESRITGAVDKKAKEFKKLLKEYDKAVAEENRWRGKIDALKLDMRRINQGMPDVIKDFLDDDQREKYDAMLELSRKTEADAGAEVKPAAGGGPDETKPARKKRLVKRKKRRPAGGSVNPAESPDAASPAAAGTAGGKPAAVAPEEGPGTTMVDNEPAAPAPRVRKKKKVLKKKAVSRPSAKPAEAPADAGGEAADEAPAAEETGAYPAEEDAGSYP